MERLKGRPGTAKRDWTKKSEDRRAGGGLSIHNKVCSEKGGVKVQTLFMVCRDADAARSVATANRVRPQLGGSAYE